MMLRKLTAIAVVLLSGLAGGPGVAQEAIGTISRIQGLANGSFDGTTALLRPDSPVFRDESLATGPKARLEVTFADDTRLTLGENARVTLDTFLYHPADGIGSVEFAVVGAFRFVSGHTSDLTNADVSISTPGATIVERGTEFWAGPIDDQALGVLLLKGAVSVANAAGTQVLDRPGEGTNIAAPGSGPGPVTNWPRDKVDRALATVTFP